MRCEQHLIVQPGCLACEVMKLEATVDVLWRLPGVDSIRGTVEVLKGEVQAVGRTAQVALEGYAVLHERISKIEERHEMEDAAAKQVLQQDGYRVIDGKLWGPSILQRYWRIFAYEAAMKKLLEKTVGIASAYYPKRDEQRALQVAATDLLKKCDKCQRPVTLNLQVDRCRCLPML